MTKRDDDNPDQWLMSGPAAWFILSLVVVTLIGFAAWSFAEFRALRLVGEAVTKAGDFDARAALRTELDLLAQQTMATAAVVAVALSAISMAFIAATVYFARDASKQAFRSAEIAQASLEEAMITSRRELRPYIDLHTISSSTYDATDYEPAHYIIIKAKIKNYGQTPYFVIRTFISQHESEEDDNIEMLGAPPIKKTIGPNEDLDIVVGYYPVKDAWENQYSSIRFSVSILGSDIFIDFRKDIFYFLITSGSPLDPEGVPDETRLSLKINPLETTNYLRAQDGVIDGAMNLRRRK